MSSKKKTCPRCQGKKVLQGHCECSSEWRGTDGEDGFSDCRCEPDVECPECRGTGVVE